MILLDTDTFSLHQLGQERLLARFQAESVAPAITVVTQVEALRGRHEWLLKAEDGIQLLRAQQGLIHTRQHLELFQIVLFDAASAVEFDRLRQIKRLKKIGRGDLLIASIALANRATLVTRNQKDFRQVAGLRIENWAD